MAVRSSLALLIAGVFSCLQVGSVAYQRQADPMAAAGAPAAAASDEVLPPLALTEETPNLLLTWISDDGDFHVVERIDAVPEGHRQKVRVVRTDQAAGTGALVYVADLERKNPDGTYPVVTLPRGEWEAHGADKRKTRLEQLAPSPPGQPPAATGAGAGDAPPVAAGEDRTVSAIVYGADWCKPCHEAERYLKSLGVAVTKKNIEESRAAHAEMREKLLRINRAGAGIPVIDVMGKIFVGYSPGPLKQAVDAARHATAPKRG